MLWMGERFRGAFTTSGSINSRSPRADEQAQAERDFLRSKPPSNQLCLACGNSYDWLAAMDETRRFWVCQKCHRPSTLTAAEWSEKIEQRRREQAAAAAEIATANTPTATRARLREAVARHGHAEITLQKLEEAARRAEDDAFDARRAVEAAREAVNKAAAIDGDAIVAAVLADAPVTQVSRRAAREALAAAEETADQATALASTLSEKAAQAKVDLGYKADAVKSAVRACLRANSAKSIATFLTDTEALQVKLAARMRGLQLLVQEGILDDTSNRRIAGFFSHEPRLWPQGDPGQQAEIAGRWKSTIDRLSRDAGAPAELK